MEVSRYLKPSGGVTFDILDANDPTQIYKFTLCIYNKLDDF
jgi:hypothetical protein